MLFVGHYRAGAGEFSVATRSSSFQRIGRQMGYAYHQLHLAVIDAFACNRDGFHLPHQVHYTS
jgi:hypothetical protein